MKICVIFGTRPEAIKLAPVIQELKKRKRIQCKVVVTAQHRQMLDQVLKLFRIKPAYDLNIMRKDQNVFDITQSVLKQLQTVLKKERPDYVLVQGDTTTTLVASLAAFYLKIPVAHVEAGLRTNDKYRPFPEEINRRLTSAICDIHFAPSIVAKRNLRLENIPNKSIHLTGNTVVDALLSILKSKKIFRHRFLKEFSFKGKTVITVTLHRRESFDGGLQQVLAALKIIARTHDVDIIFPVHLNPNVRNQVNRKLKSVKNIHLIKPLDYDDFVFLLRKSYFVISDSGGIQEEICTLKKPVLVPREKTEREEAIHAGFAKLVGYNQRLIINEANRLLTDNRYYRSKLRHKNPFGDGKAAQRIVRILTR